MGTKSKSKKKSKISTPNKPTKATPTKQPAPVNLFLSDTILQSEYHQHCLSQVLSFLECKDLVSLARSSKPLRHIIFEEQNDNDDKVDMIWEGAEEGLTNPWDKQPMFGGKFRRVGSNARDHCHFFAIALKASEACELSGEMEGNRIKVDGLLSNLMDVRGFDAESVAGKKSDNEEQDDCDAQVRRLLSRPTENAQVRRLISGSAEAEEIEELMGTLFFMTMIKEMSPEKVCHHEVFIRISHLLSGEVISQGFCNRVQRLPWALGLDSKEAKQGLELTLDSESLVQTKEMRKFLVDYMALASACLGSSSCNDYLYEKISDFKIPFCITAMVIDKRDLSVECLFQQDKTKELQLRRVFPTPRSEVDRMKLEFKACSTWGGDPVQLGPSPGTDRYKLSYSLSLHVIPPDYGLDVIPVLDIDIELDDE